MGETKGMTDNRAPVEEAQSIVFIVDDDPSVSRSISRLLGAMGFQFEIFASAEEFLASAPYQGVGCLVLDVRMPGLSGMDLQEALAKAECSIPIIFITGHGSIPMGITAMKRGAVDFLPKPFDDKELLEAVKKALAQHRETKRVEKEKDDGHRQMNLLTGREREVFNYVVTGMLNKQIAYTLGIAEKTVKAHRGRITEKLGINSVADLVRFAERVGVSAPDSREGKGRNEPR
jgi:FixJ family two-component response regulator